MSPLYEKYNDPYYTKLINYLLDQKWCVTKLRSLWAECEEDFDRFLEEEKWRDLRDEYPALYRERITSQYYHAKEKLAAMLTEEYADQYLMADIFDIDWDIVAELLVEHRDVWEIEECLTLKAKGEL